MPTKPKSARTRAGRLPAVFNVPADPQPNWPKAKAALEVFLLREALTREDGNMAAAARRLGITKVAVLHAVRRHGLDGLTRSRA